MLLVHAARVAQAHAVVTLMQERANQLLHSVPCELKVKYPARFRAPRLRGGLVQARKVLPALLGAAVIPFDASSPRAHRGAEQRLICGDLQSSCPLSETRSPF